MKTPLRSVLFVLVLAGLLADGATADDQYTITDLGKLANVWSVARAISTGGQIVGTSSVPFLWDDGVMTGLPLGTSDSAGAYGLNDGGQIVGMFMHQGRYTAAEWADNGSGYVVAPIGPSGTTSHAYDINDSGKVVGQTFDYPRAFVWTTEGGIQFLTAFGFASAANSVNNIGAVAGTATDAEGREHAVVWGSDGDIIGSIVTSDVGDATAKSINEHYEVAGHYDVSGEGGETQRRAFFWSDSSGLVDIAPSARDSRAFGINNHGQVVGVMDFEEERHAFLWSLAGGLVDLGTLGGTYSIAYGINDSGYVVGMSTCSAEEASKGLPLERAVLWAPVPEPSSLLALLCGIGACFRLRRR